MSLTMGTLDADQWLSDQGEGLLRSMSERSKLLNQMVEDYIVSLNSDPTLAAIVQLCNSRSRAEQETAVAKEARAAVWTFLAGDWTCVTFIGMLLQNAFQRSDPRQYPLNDSSQR